MNLDYQGMSKQVIEAFIAFVNRTSSAALDEMKETIREREQAMLTPLPSLFSVCPMSLAHLTILTAQM